MVLVAVAAMAAVTDILQRRIPNWQVGIALALACALAWSAGGLASLGWGLLHACVALAVGAALFHFKMIGGGDAKFYAAVAAAIPIMRGFELLWWTCMGGAVLLLVLTLPRLIARQKIKDSGVTVPFGVAIFIGLVGTLV